MDGVAAAIERSNGVVLDVVWPVVGPLWGGGVLTPKLDEFDVTAGIDFTWRHGASLDGVAARVQYLKAGAAPYDTFTIRTRTASRSRATEARKRAHSIAHGSMFPTYTLQAYVAAPSPVTRVVVQGNRRTMLTHQPSPQLLSAAMCHTTALYEVKDRRIRHETVNGDGSAFVVVAWAELAGHWLKHWQAVS